ncbi:gluconokinase [Rhodococcus sp. D2-41]|uniref:Gluconokinase n=1 Tax=Speluncibacter jeojiensis TaxID=2710754 RepID=A0A9X4M4D3_9ACTN|nr:gluconokinase [Rhodococcus sp. D2-41]MDG3010474.1 gluconokinase [Rhodococcus sp. D2-41]MDG3014221.1 gluconokinase [Corynebacteriales bacterium D3-21]
MGVSGTGKTTIGRMLAARLGLPYADADDFHTAANIAKMSAGVPLDDADRRPWLSTVGGWLHDRVAEGSGGVIACSALKRSYRDILRAAAPDAFFLLLIADRALLSERLDRRGGHFMSASLLDSQLAALEPLLATEAGAALHVGPGPEEMAEQAFALVRGFAGRGPD